MLSRFFVIVFIDEIMSVEEAEDTALMSAHKPYNTKWLKENHHTTKNLWDTHRNDTK